jgi:hypothetical protein
MVSPHLHLDAPLEALKRRGSSKSIAVLFHASIELLNVRLPNSWPMRLCTISLRIPRLPMPYGRFPLGIRR